MPTRMPSDRHHVRVEERVATFSPSTAPSTVIAGVIMPSPYSSAAPKIPSSTSTGQRQPRRRAAAG